jgi:hypothetical protein
MVPAFPRMLEACAVRLVETIGPRPIHPMALQPTSGLDLLYWGSVTAVFYGVGLLAPRPTPNLEDQVSVFMTPRNRVVQLYPRALGSSGTSGMPLPVPTIVGPWGDRPTSIIAYLVARFCEVSTYFSYDTLNLTDKATKIWTVDIFL